MKKITLSLLFVLLMTSIPARADFLTALLINAGEKLVTSAAKGVVNTVKEVVVPKESVENKAVREKEEVEHAVDQILAQYPEDQRAELRPKFVEQMTLANAQFKTMEARQEAIKAEQNSVGNVVTSALAGAAKNHVTIDAASRAAFNHVRF